MLQKIRSVLVVEEDYNKIMATLNELPLLCKTV